MAMVIQHNIMAQLALGELNKNNSKLKKSLEKVSSGQKIVGAKDDSSAYAISEKMREQIRSLQQDNQNVQNGSSLLKTAEGGINSIVEELRNLKELAINAATDTNTDEDRRIIQKDFEQKMANINDIATTTNYNGKTLLDGFGKTAVFEAGCKIVYSDWLDPVTYKFVNGSNPTFGVDIDELFEPTEPVKRITADNKTINSDGVYVLAKDFTGVINVNAQNVKITQEDFSTTLNQVYIRSAPRTGTLNLWLENLNISNDTSVEEPYDVGFDDVAPSALTVLTVK